VHFYDIDVFFFKRFSDYVEGLLKCDNYYKNKNKFFSVNNLCYDDNKI